MKNKLIAFLLAAASMLFCFAGCTSGETENTTAETTAQVTGEETQGEVSFPYSFTDSTGEKITLNERPQKVAVMFSSYAEIWTLSGGSIALTVGDSITRGFAPEGTPLAGESSGMKVDKEAIVAAMPDFVILTADLASQSDARDLLKECGIPAAAFREETIDDYLYMLRIFCDINGTPEIYELHGTAVRDEISMILSTCRKQSFSYLFVRAGSALSSTKVMTAESHFACGMIDELGGVNIASGTTLFSDGLSLEAIVKADPDRIFVIAMGKEETSFAFFRSLLETDGWSSLSAVKSGKVVYLSKALYNYKPNQRWAEAYVKLIESLESIDQK